MFTAGYLTTGGQDYETDKKMIEDAGFEVEMDGPAPEPTVNEKIMPSLHPNHA